MDEPIETPGVTPPEGPAPTPPPEGSPPAEPGDGKTPEGEIKALPFGEHPRWIKMTAENRELKGRLQKMEQETGSLEGARNLDTWLRKNPQNLKAVLELMDGKAKEPDEDPYGAYDADTAERFRKLDALEQWKAEQEDKQERDRVGSIEGNKRSIDEEFEGLLVSDGFMKEDGEPVDEDLVELVEDAVLARLMKIAEDPDLPTKSEMKKAYKSVTAGLELAEKRGLKKAVPPDVPPSGTNRGTPPSPGGDKPQTDAERIASIADAL